MSWLVLMTAPNPMKSVAKLVGAGFDVFLPLYWRSDRQVPLYGRYAFAEGDSHWWALQGRDEVSRVLTIDDSPCVVGDTIVGDLMLAMLRGNGAIRLPDALDTTEFQAGQWVRVKQGKDHGKIGRWKVARNGHSRIDIDTARGKATISVPTHYLAPLVSGSPAP